MVLLINLVSMNVDYSPIKNEQSHYLPIKEI